MCESLAGFHEKYCSVSHISERRMWDSVKFELAFLLHPIDVINTKTSLLVVYMAGGST